MARLESISIGGYYPTPPHLISRIGALISQISFPKSVERTSAGYTYEDDASKGEISVMDPCAGDGAAVLGILTHLLGEERLKKSACDNQVHLYASELEGSRAEALAQNVRNVHYGFGKGCLAGDAFQITFSGPNESKSGIGLLFLNPPYDTDPVHGRFEQRFLDRFTPALAVGGLLVFLVPFYALKASADLLAREYDDLRCFRFPSADFEAYSQVVLIARKRESRLEPNPKILAQVQAWAADVSSEPELPYLGAEPLYSVPIAKRYYGGISEWRMHRIDLTAILSKVRPWTVTMRSGGSVPVAGVLPDVPVQGLLLRTYPVAVPPRPAHIAAGIASGLFNGARIEPKSDELPSLLVKGVFDREYRTIEEKKNKDGEVTTVIQVQQPKLVTTVLDLSTHKYHTLSSGTEATGTLDVERMNVADLLAHYGDSLMSVMERQCPVLYDPRRDANSIKLAASPRRLFTAQEHATKAIIKLLGGANVSRRARRGKSAILLGEIGSGKSTVALMTARTIGAVRPLILCPPHLLDGWKEQVAAVLPDAEVRVLTDVEELNRVSEIPSDRTVVCILSRETAKLSHSWEGVSGACPKCGSGLSVEAETLAKKRVRCGHRKLVTKDALAKECRALAVRLLPYAPEDVSAIVKGRFSARRVKHYTANTRKFKGLGLGTLDQAIDSLVQGMIDHKCTGAAASRALSYILLAAASDDKIVEVATKFFDAKRSDAALEALLLLGPDHAALEGFKSQRPEYVSAWCQWGIFDSRREQLRLHKEIATSGDVKLLWTESRVMTAYGHARYSLPVAVRAMETIGALGTFGWSSECGEELFASVPEPRRVALAKHIVKYHRDTFDFLVLDEGHEYATDGSAQERSAHRLTSLGIPTVLMTGSIMNGYAESLFMNMWYLSPDFRAEFARDERQRYVDRYGYRKRAIQDKDQEGNVVEFGSQSDRVTLRSERIVGSAPGILPLFLLRHLLPISVTLHKSDLAIDLPECRQERHEVKPSSELLSRYNKLKDALVAQIRKDQFVPDLAGKLFGQLAELPSYLDRATDDTGNTDRGAYEIRYPESLESKVVAAQEGFDSDTLLAKEEWLLDLVETKLAEGRNVMVFSWHVALLPRIARLIEKRTGQKVPILYADKVATGKRQDWINREVLKKGRRILVTNPVAIQTGLNNLIHFSAEVWMENPACNVITFRQAIGRIDRIGQTRDTEIHFPVYTGTLQEQLYDLLMKKVAVSVSTDGLDPESALQAAGLGEDDYLAGLSIGKQLWSMIGGMGTVVPMDAHRHAKVAMKAKKVGT